MCKAKFTTSFIYHVPDWFFKENGGRDILVRNGIELKIEGLKIHLDPKKAENISFVSHAHSDHCPRSFTGTIFASMKTCALMRKEPLGECWHKSTSIDGVKFSFYESGHIPGSSQLLIENGSKVLYTGDLNYKGGLITPRAQTPECDVLIIEATFGTPRYSFPDKLELVKEMVDWAKKQIHKGLVPVFLGYPMGKSQELTKALSEDFTVFIDESGYQFNKRTENLGIDLGRYFPMSEPSKKEDTVIIAPPNKAKTFDREKHAIGLVSGWTINKAWGHRFTDIGFPLSDHSDYNSLIQYVEKVSPQAVYTTHGYASELSRSLRENGFYSEPLSEVQSKLDGF